jgi:hypothetical protein
MSMYRFVKGAGSASRLFVQGTREGGDRDDINGDVVPRHDGINDLQAVYTRRQLNTEVLGSTVKTTKTSRRPSSGTRSVTTRIVRKTTTLTRGEERALTESLVRRAGDQALVQAAERVGLQPAIQAKRAKVGETRTFILHNIHGFGVKLNTCMSGLLDCNWRPSGEISH